MTMATHDRREPTTMTLSNNQNHNKVGKHGSRCEQDDGKAVGHKSAELLGKTSKLSGTRETFA